MDISDFRVTGLVGCDFSGSTVLSSILDGLPNVAAVGETHWIVDKDHGCRECRDQPCPIFTAELRETLRALKPEERPRCWWPFLAQATGSEVLISSDKRPLHYQRLGLPDSWIFLYKDPVAHVYSQARRLALRRNADQLEDEDIKQAISWYVKNSNERLSYLQGVNGPVGVMRNESLVDNPTSAIENVARFLEVSVDMRALEYWTHEQHYIGGNFSVKNVSRSTSMDPSLRIDKSYERHIHPDQQEMIRKNSGVVAVLETIQREWQYGNWILLG